MLIYNSKLFGCKIFKKANGSLFIKEEISMAQPDPASENKEPQPQPQPVTQSTPKEIPKQGIKRKASAAEDKKNNLNSTRKKRASSGCVFYSERLIHTEARIRCARTREDFWTVVQELREAALSQVAPELVPKTTKNKQGLNSTKRLSRTSLELNKSETVSKKSKNKKLSQTSLTLNKSEPAPKTRKNKEELNDNLKKILQTDLELNKSELTPKTRKHKQRLNNKRTPRISENSEESVKNPNQVSSLELNTTATKQQAPKNKECPKPKTKKLSKSLVEFKSKATPGNNISRGSMSFNGSIRRKLYTPGNWLATFVKTYNLSQ